jgi:hypothetical protein
MPSKPLSSFTATGTSSNGSSSIAPLTILLTCPVFFSKTKISSGPRNAILEGNSIPSAYFSIARLESASTIVGSLLGEEPN